MSNVDGHESTGGEGGASGLGSGTEGTALVCLFASFVFLCLFADITLTMISGT